MSVTRIVSPAAVKLLEVPSYPTPDDHFITAPHCCVKTVDAEGALMQY